MADTEATLIEIIKAHSVGFAGELTRATPIGDLGIDSFAVVEILYAVEEKLGVEIPFNANQNPFGDMKTVGDMLDAFAKLMAEKKA